MMPLQEKIAHDLIEAIKSKDETRVSTLRMLKAAIKNQQVEKGGDLSDQDILRVLATLVRRGEESAKEFRAGGRTDLAEREESQRDVLFGYRPEQMDSAAIERTLREIIAELNASGPRDMGKVMKAAMSRLAGKAQGNVVSDIAKRLLSPAPPS